MTAEARNVRDQPSSPRRYKFQELAELYAQTDGFLAITPEEYKSMQGDSFHVRDRPLKLLGGDLESVKDSNSTKRKLEEEDTSVNRVKMEPPSNTKSINERREQAKKDRIETKRKMELRHKIEAEAAAYTSEAKGLRNKIAELEREAEDLEGLAEDRWQFLRELQEEIDAKKR